MLKYSATVVSIVAVLTGGASAALLQGSTGNRTLVEAVHDDGRHVDAQATPRTSVQGRKQATLPNGADALKETYGDWAVECTVIGIQNKCSLVPSQHDQQQRASMFSVEILIAESGENRLAVMMPFGLNLADGIRLTLDDRPAEQRGSFATCLPNGCLVPLTLPDASIEAIKKAKNLRVSATAFGGGQGPTFTVSLKGFSTAIERLKNLQ
ncbi:invasion associated locus B family protein [Sinorhizobium meliloti]|uniref:invasion associated locus B family protein n=1 Tax=Rhizobium meliloti TaxID=382 RepID=UPI003F16D544